MAGGHAAEALAQVAKHEGGCGHGDRPGRRLCHEVQHDERDGRAEIRHSETGPIWRVHPRSSRLSLQGPAERELLYCRLKDGKREQGSQR